MGGPVEEGADILGRHRGYRSASTMRNGAPANRYASQTCWHVFGTRKTLTCKLLKRKTGNLRDLVRFDLTISSMAWRNINDLE